MTIKYNQTKYYDEVAAIPITDTPFYQLIPGNIYPPPGTTAFMITEAGDDMLTEDGFLMVTEF